MIFAIWCWRARTAPIDNAAVEVERGTELEAPLRHRLKTREFSMESNAGLLTEGRSNAALRPRSRQRQFRRIREELHPNVSYKSRPT